MGTTSPGIAPLQPIPPQGPDQRWWNALQQIVNWNFNGSRTTAQRPSSPVIGQHMFDTTLGLPIWCKSLNPVVWVDASGTAV